KIVAALHVFQDRHVEPSVEPVAVPDSDDRYEQVAACHQQHRFTSKHMSDIPDRRFIIVRGQSGGNCRRWRFSVSTHGCLLDIEKYMAWHGDSWCKASRRSQLFWVLRARARGRSTQPRSFGAIITDQMNSW